MYRNNREQENSRINILEDILVRLHRGAEPYSVQKDFEKNFSDVSAIEIAGMEQQIIFNHDEVNFEDVLKLCNVHARTFENKIEDSDGYEIEHPGHPVRIFKDENRALNSTLLRIRNILNALEKNEEASEVKGIYQGLANQYQMLGQFDIHYERKEKLFFPILEKYGYQAPPKVMWAKDDEIRDLFEKAYSDMKALPRIDLQTVRASFEEFEYEFKEMIFKEEAILLNMMLETLETKDWYQIANESEYYGYTIIRPTEEWEPILESEQKGEEQVPTILETQKVPFGSGIFTLTFETPKREVTLDRNALIKISDGHLSLNQIQSVFNNLPMDLTLIDHSGKIVFQNEPIHQKQPATNRRANALGNFVTDAYPSKESDKILTMLESDSNHPNQNEIKESSNHGIAKSYHTLLDNQNEFIGILEIAEHIRNFIEIKGTNKTKFRDIEDVNDSIFFMDIDIDPSPSLENDPQIETKKVAFDGGDLTVSYERNTNQNIDPNTLTKDTLFDFQSGELTLNQIEAIFNALPLEITFVDGENIFRYFNRTIPFEDMIFQRTPAQIGRHLEFCHPPKLWDRVNSLIHDLRSEKRSKELLWYEGEDSNSFVHITYQGMLDENHKYIGTLELVRDIRAYQLK